MDVVGVNLITYGCHGNSNQRFGGVARNEHVLLGSLSTASLQRLLPVVSQLK